MIEYIQAALYSKLKKDYETELQKLTALRDMFYTVSYVSLPEGGFNELTNSLQGTPKAVQIDYRAAEKEFK